MATTTFLGYPPAGIRSWIKGNTPTPTPTPSTNSWTCSVSTYESSDITSCQLEYSDQDLAWTGSFTYDQTTTQLVLRQTTNGDSYTWEISENNGQFIPIDNANISPDLVNPTSITTNGMTIGSYIYNFSRSI